MNSSLTTLQLKPAPRAVHFRAHANQAASNGAATSNNKSGPQVLKGKQEQVQECVVILSNN